MALLSSIFIFWIMKLEIFIQQPLFNNGILLEVLSLDDQILTGGCGFYGKIWNAVSSLGYFKTVSDWLLILYGFSVMWVIWKEWNRHIFQHKEEDIHSLGEKVKLHSLNQHLLFLILITIFEGLILFLV